MSINPNEPSDTACKSEFQIISAPKSGPGRPGSQGLAFTSVILQLVQAPEVNTHTHTSAQLNSFGLQDQHDNPWTGTPSRSVSWCLRRAAPLTVMLPSCCTHTQTNLKAICSPACTQWPVTCTSALSAARLPQDLCQPAFPVDEKDLGLMQTRWSLQQVNLRLTHLIDPRLSGTNVITSR